MFARWRPDDSLFRGDGADGVSVPDPAAGTTAIEHVLYLHGAGGATPFTSTTESRDVATRFAGSAGRVWTTEVPAATANGARHLPRLQLLQDLRGRGRGQLGRARADLVAKARVFVELHREHLLDWRSVDGAEIAGAITRTFRRG